MSLVELATEELARRFGSSQACWRTVVDEVYRVITIAHVRSFLLVIAVAYREGDILAWDTEVIAVNQTQRVAMEGGVEEY